MNEQKEMELPAEPEWMGMGSREGTCQASVCSLVFVWSQPRFGVKVKVKSLTCVRLFATSWTVAYQAAPSMGFSRRLHFHFSLSCIGEGKGNPLQCSCLENPRDGGAWWAAVYGVAQSGTRLKRLSTAQRGTASGF